MVKPTHMLSVSIIFVCALSETCNSKLFSQPEDVSVNITVTKPLLIPTAVFPEIITIFSSRLVQVPVLSAFNVVVDPTHNSVVPAEIVGLGFTVKVSEIVSQKSADLIKVKTALPGDIPVTRPALSTTVAISILELVQVPAASAVK